MDEGCRLEAQGLPVDEKKFNRFKELSHIIKEFDDFLAKWGRCPSFDIEEEKKLLKYSNCINDYFWFQGERAVVDQFHEYNFFNIKQSIKAWYKCLSPGYIVVAINSMNTKEKIKSKLWPILDDYHNRQFKSNTKNRKEKLPNIPDLRAQLFKATKYDDEKLFDILTIFDLSNDNKTKKKKGKEILGSEIINGQFCALKGKSITEASRLDVDRKLKLAKSFYSALRGELFDLEKSSSPYNFESPRCL